MKNVILAVSLILSIQLMSQTTKPETLVVIHTNYGDITAKLYNDTPLHRDNFIKLINEGWYEGSYYHRVIEGFMIQGGHSKGGVVDPGYTIPAEILPNHFHKKGALCAARMGDHVNPEKRSSGSQFYVVQGQPSPQTYLDKITAQSGGHVLTPEQKKTYETLGGTPHLDGDYTVFGEVLDGFDVIDKIAAVETTGREKGYVPIVSVTMTIEILE